MAGPGRSAAFAVLGVETGLAWLVACPLPVLAQESGGRGAQDAVHHAAIGAHRVAQASAPHIVPDAATRPRLESGGSQRPLPNLAMTPAPVAPSPSRRDAQSGNGAPAATLDLRSHMTAFAQRFGRGLGSLRIAQEFAPHGMATRPIRGEDHGPIASHKSATTPALEDDLPLAPENPEDRRRFQDRDPMSYIKQRDWHYATYLGFDLAEALDVRKPWLRDLSLGVEWPKIKSVVADGDRSNPAAPAITMGIAF